MKTLKTTHEDTLGVAFTYIVALPIFVLLIPFILGRITGDIGGSGDEW